MLSSDWIKVIANWFSLKAQEAKYLGVFCLFDSILKSAREGAARQLTQPTKMLMAGRHLEFSSPGSSPHHLSYSYPGLSRGGGGSFGDEEASWKGFPMFWLEGHSSQMAQPETPSPDWLPDGNPVLEPLIETSPRRLLFESRQWVVLHPICQHWQSVWPHIAIRLSGLSTYEHLLREG